MTLTPKKYKKRLIDKTIDDYLSVFGSVLIEGPKWCGKTWTSLNHAKSAVYLDDEDSQSIAEIDPELTLQGENPRLIDEWQEVPLIWDKIRRDLDKTSDKGKFILTESTKLPTKLRKKTIKHSGTGRIARLEMETMSLYESGVSKGEASLTDMKNDVQENKNVKKFNLNNIIDLIIRGGWPENIDTPSEKAHIIPIGYINSVLEDIDDPDEDGIEGKTRDREKMRMILTSLARNETTMATDKKILNDTSSYTTDQERLLSMNTLLDYLGVIKRLHLISNQPVYSTNYVSADRIGKASKRHLVDPSLDVALLGLTKKKLLSDPFTLGFLFEALVERDLRIYMNYLGGSLFHFRDNVTKLEVDSIIEFSDGEYAAIEIKLGTNKIPEAKENLSRYYNLTNKKPKFMAIICGTASSVIKDPETGIYILPLQALKP